MSFYFDNLTTAFVKNWKTGQLLELYFEYEVLWFSRVFQAKTSSFSLTIENEFYDVKKNTHMLRTNHRLSDCRN